LIASLFMRILHCAHGFESTKKLLTSFIFSSPGYLDDLQSSGLSGDQSDVPGVEIEAPGQKIE